MYKHGNIHKTRNTECITTPPNEDQAKAMGNMQQKFGEVWTCGF